MRKNDFKFIAFVFLVHLCLPGGTRQAPAQAKKAAYPAMAPIDEYLVADQDSEIALARSDGEGYSQGKCFAALSNDRTEVGQMQGVIQFTPTAIQITVTCCHPEVRSDEGSAVVFFMISGGILFHL
jgi:hypothetical protein